MTGLINQPPACWPAAFAAGLIGLLIGSFLNVVIHRLPKMMLHAEENDLCLRNGIAAPQRERYNLLLPHSHCPGCARPLALRHNLPLLGFLLARGQCAHCGGKIPLRYPLIELLSGLVAAWLAWHFGSGGSGLAALLFGFSLIALGAIDAETGLLPDDLTLPLLWCGLLVNLKGRFVPLSDAVLGVVAGYLALWLVFQCYRLVTGKEAIGYGDFKLLAALGAWLGWMMLPLVLLLASIAGMMIGIGLKLTHRAEAGAMLPFGPYLAVAGIAMLVYGPIILQRYLFMLGISDP